MDLKNELAKHDDKYTDIESKLVPLNEILNANNYCNTTHDKYVLFDLIKKQ
jgi:hypothetical protein